MDPNSKKTILLVEDNADDIELASRIFEKCQVSQQVQAARDGKEALDYIFGRGAHDGQGFAKALRLILLDLNLPQIPGIDVLRELKADPRTRAIPIVVLTVSGMEKEHLENESLGVTAYLRKPIEFHDFLNLYHSYVE